MQTKANLTDVKRTISEIATSLEQRVTFPELKRMLESKVDQAELKMALGSRDNVNINDLINKTNELTVLKKTGSPDDLMQRIQDLEEQLSEKASKQSVAQALHRKLNRADFDELVQRKVDISEMAKVFESLDKKADDKSFDKLFLQLQDKVGRSEIQQIIRKGALAYGPESSQFNPAQLQHELDTRMVSFE